MLVLVLYPMVDEVTAAPGAVEAVAANEVTLEHQEVVDLDKGLGEDSDEQQRQEETAGLRTEDAVGRRGKSAATIRRGGINTVGSFGMAFRGGFQGNFEEEE